MLAFALMVALSYMSNSGTVRKNLIKNAGSVLSFTQKQIESELVASKMMLGSFSQTARQMILDGRADSLQHYINTISEYVESGDSGLKNINGLYGYFEFAGDEGILLYCQNLTWNQPEEVQITGLSWYEAALENCGAVVETQPYVDFFSGEYIITYARCIHDNDDRRIGVVCIDVPLKRVGEIAVNAALIEGGYGALASRDLTIFAHANPAYVGRHLDDPDLPISRYSDDFLQSRNIYESSMKNWKGEDVIAFTRTLPNGWYLILLTPKNLYYHSTGRMLAILCVMGAILASALIAVLISIEKAREKAGEESRQKSAFLANMSHEIRTPMNAIIGMTYIGKSADDVPRKDYCLDKIENASQHLLGVINDVLDMSKIEANMFELACDEFNFEKMLQRVISIVGFRAEEKKQKVSVHIDNSIPRALIGDDQRLAQVITNLFGNAVKFTPEGGSIILDTRFVSEEDGVYTMRITITDNGIGISGEQQKYLFRSFQQADSGISRRFGGTGLGLVISRNIVEMMGGKIELVSEPGKGSSFSFTFKARKGLQKSVDLSEAGIDWNTVKVMAVDDDKDILDYFKDVMSSFGTSCDTALSGEEALSHIDKNGMNHIYFVDWKMRGMDGVKLAKELKERSGSLNDTVVIMISAADWSSIADEAKKAGVDKFLSKPLFPSAIADAIAEAIGMNKTEHEEKKDYDGIFKGNKILFAEDVEINREIMEVLIEPTLLEMDYAVNGTAAVSMFEKSPDAYDLILMDVQMPEMDGYEATRRIRDFEDDRKTQMAARQPGEQPRHAGGIPIIAMTANIFREDIEKCKKAGMNDHLGKPLDVEEFFGIMRKYLPKTQ